MVSIRRDELLKKREVANRFRVTTRTVEKWIKNGKLEAVHVGGLVYTSYEALERFVRHHVNGEPREDRTSTTELLAINHGV